MIHVRCTRGNPTWEEPHGSVVAVLGGPGTCSLRLTCSVSRKHCQVLSHLGVGCLCSGSFPSKSEPLPQNLQQAAKAGHEKSQHNKAQVMLLLRTACLPPQVLGYTSVRALEHAKLRMLQHMARREFHFPTGLCAQMGHGQGWALWEEALKRLLWFNMGK